jgi:hypothetical protein
MTRRLGAIQNVCHWSIEARRSQRVKTSQLTLDQDARIRYWGKYVIRRPEDLALHLRADHPQEAVSKSSGQNDAQKNPDDDWAGVNRGIKSDAYIIGLIMTIR